MLIVNEDDSEKMKEYQQDIHEDIEMGISEHNERQSIPDYPMYAYIYDHFYKGEWRWKVKHHIENKEQLGRYMQEDVVRALEAKQEVRITDVLDNLIFHAVGGKIIWPTEEMIEATEEWSDGVYKESDLK